jgi:hypothetical protein
MMGSINRGWIVALSMGICCYLVGALFSFETLALLGLTVANLTSLYITIRFVQLDIEAKNLFRAIFTFVLTVPAILLLSTVLGEMPPINAEGGLQVAAERVIRNIRVLSEFYSLENAKVLIALVLLGCGISAGYVIFRKTRQIEK